MSPIGTSLFLRTCLIVVAAAAAVAAITLTAGYRAAAASQERHAAALAKTVSEAALEPAYELDVKALRQLAASVLAGDDALSAVFLDAGGRVLTDGTDDNPQRGQQVNTPVVRQAREMRQWVTSLDGGLVHVAGPVTATEDSHLGFVVLTFSTARLFSTWLEHMQQALILTGLSLLLACGASLQMAQRFCRPIEQLASHAARLAQNPDERSVPDFGPGKIGRTAEAISDVLGKARDKQPGK